jgi:peptide deformylase
MGLILIAPHPTLKKISKPVTDFEAVRLTVETMETEMRKAGGVGLSAIQIGLPLRVFVSIASGGLVAFINPELTLGGATGLVEEGCLSTPGIYSIVRRFCSVGIKYTDIDGNPQSKTLTGLVAQVAQHENEHLDGKLYTQHLTSAERGRILGELLKYKKSHK